MTVRTVPLALFTPVTASPATSLILESENPNPSNMVP